MKSVFNGFIVSTNKDIQDEYQEVIRGLLQKIIAFDFYGEGTQPKKIVCGSYTLTISEDQRFLEVGKLDLASLLFKVGLKGQVTIRNGWRGHKELNHVVLILEEILAFPEAERVAVGI